MPAERRATGDLLREPSQTSAHDTLVELGLLPNYSLTDTTTQPEATLYWTEEQADGDGEAARTKSSEQMGARRAAPGTHARRVAGRSW